MEDQLGVRARLLAAGGAAFVAATIVNPLDVIKTRMQAQAAAASSAPAGSLHHSTLYEPPSRQLFHQLSYNDIIKAVHHDPPQAPQRRFAVGCGSTVVLPTDELPWDYRRWGITEAPLCTKYAPGACSSSSSSLRVCAAVQGAAGPGAAALPTSSLWDACRHIVRYEGVPVLWRGTATSLLIAVPMVGIYMPLYDHLLERCSPSLGGAAPVVAGMSARAFACFAVAPFELLRTRFQAMGGRDVTLRDTIATLTNSSHGSSSSHTSSWASSGGSPSLGRRAHAAAADTLLLLRTVPQWWTGFGATLVRDVPFSALYWAMVEPLRSAMLPKQSHFPWPGLRHSAPTGAAAGSSSSSSRAAADATGVGSSAVHAAGPAASVRPGGGQRVHHSQQEILLANMVSGLVAGGLAAAATTPFDVVKTRHQIMSRAAGSERRSVLGTLRDVYAQEGWEGLFTGVKPRAYRAAPACAIVISVYELLKSWLSEQ